jgi:hypothetical protein
MARRTRSTDVVGSAMPAFRPVGPAAASGGGSSGNLRSASTSVMFHGGFLLQKGGGSGNSSGSGFRSSGAISDTVGHEQAQAQAQQQDVVMEDGRQDGNMSPPAKRSKAD